MIVQTAHAGERQEISHWLVQHEMVQAGDAKSETEEAIKVQIHNIFTSFSPP